MVSGEHLGNIYRMVLTATGDVFHLLLNVLFFLISLFFVYKDGDRVLAHIDIVGERILPKRWQRFSRVVPATVNSTVTGMGLIAIGEGVVLGIAYWIAGVPSPALLGAVTGFMALIPGGAPLSFTLVSIDRKSTRLNSSHVAISYDVFCLKEKIISYTRSRERYPDLE